jgi:riboflavin synthase
VFTGIIEAVGVVTSWSRGVLLLDPNDLDLSNLQMGESIAVSGVCLTVVSFEGGKLRFDLSPETINITCFKDLVVGARCNLERAMKLTDRLGGHIVQGHVDGIGKFVKQRIEGNSVVMTFEIPNPQYIVQKGSITINGISLTVVDPRESEFDVWVIPHTLQMTQLGDLKPGNIVNIEYDMIAKYVERLSQFQRKA